MQSKPEMHSGMDVKCSRHSQNPLLDASLMLWQGASVLRRAALHAAPATAWARRSVGTCQIVCVVKIWNHMDRQTC
jgi:hypothetical protein